MNWFDIFRAGTHADSSGRDVTVTRDDLARLTASYDPTHHEAPIVVGHPRTDDPAYGWVKALRLDGDTLQALPGEVEPQFAQAVRDGRYKKISAKFQLTPQGLVLRHVGVLGAVPPAVKGLRPVQFAGEDGAPSIEFVQELDDSNREEADMAVQDAIDALRKQIESLGQTVESLKPAAGAAPDPKVQALETQLAELRASLQKMEQDKAASEAAFAEAEKRRATAAREARFAALVQAGKALPAERDRILAFAQALEAQGGEVEFAAPDGGTVKRPLAEEFWADLDRREPHGLLAEFAAPGGAAAQAVSTASGQASSVNLAAKF